MKYLILVFIFLIACSDTSSPEDVAEAQILEILDTIIACFPFDLEGIMQNYHPDFLHNGDDYDFEVIIWEIRINHYNEIDFTDIDIVPDGDFATASFIMTLDEDVFNEPDDHGDVSHFYRDFDGWKICGKDFLEP